MMLFPWTCLLIQTFACEKLLSDIYKKTIKTLRVVSWARHSWDKVKVFSFHIFIFFIFIRDYDYYSRGNIFLPYISVSFPMFHILCMVRGSLITFHKYIIGHWIRQMEQDKVYSHIRLTIYVIQNIQIVNVAVSMFFRIKLSIRFSPDFPSHIMPHCLYVVFL